MNDKKGFFYKGKTLISNFNPEGKANFIADSLEIIDRTLFLCPSPLHGYGLERLLERLNNMPNCAVLCIEADPDLYDLSYKHLGASNFAGNPKLFLSNCCDEVQLCKLLRQKWGARFFRRVELVHFTGGWQLSPELYQKIFKSLHREAAIDWGNALTLVRLGRYFMRNVIRNLSMLHENNCFSPFSFGSDPVLLLGAGPSLDNVLNYLYSRFGSALNETDKRPFRIICVDTCLPALKERGIRPDLAVILESQHWNLKDFIGLSGWQTAQALDLSALPRSASVLCGPKLWFFTPWTELKIFSRLESAGLLLEKLPPLGSVGLSAVSVALRLTQGNIIIAGLDFSFTADKFYARGTPGYWEKLRFHNRFTGLLNEREAFGETAYRAVSKNNEQVYTKPVLRSYRDLFEREFSKSARVFDCFDSGLPLGLKSLTVQQACELLSAGSCGFKSPLGSSLEGSSVKIIDFIRCEQKRLLSIRKMLTGEAHTDQAELAALIDECDYLWSHFPEWAATERRPGIDALETWNPSAISFLKRVRAEIDPFLKLWEQAFNQLALKHK